MKEIHFRMILVLWRKLRQFEEKYFAIGINKAPDYSTLLLRLNKIEKFVYYENSPC